MYYRRSLNKFTFRFFANYTKNYYKILGVEPTASLIEIKNRYKTLAKEFHPDINPSKANYFKEINEAYGLLSKPSERRKYDETFKTDNTMHRGNRSEANYNKYDNFYNSVNLIALSNPQGFLSKISRISALQTR